MGAAYAYGEYDDNPRFKCAAWVLFAILFLISAGMVANAVCGIAEVLAINPVQPTFHLQYATVSLLNVSASEFTTTWDVTLVASNPNHKLNISYDSLQATVFYGPDHSERRRVLLATKPVPHPLECLTTKANTTLRFKIETVPAYVGDVVSREILDGRARGMVRFELNMLGWYKYTSYKTSARMFQASFKRFRFGFLPGNWTGSLAPTGQSRSPIG
ncbi:unnamed protein product [Prunus armeniaca]|uniref:Late embryogenesis abundant protein LEA-2 subgroup domain-containing protein n=1 Tax=Prunus armeniaca TaxID=36596 RepID=A0A6J5VWR4_PRUAR|nr:hypothetical protein GBA52_027410 [Prunus armeniaca]CAB4290298.1 unnamed protein product [Prunus armeniaca]